MTGEILPGLRIDDVPFSLDDRPAMAWLYDLVPSTREEAEGLTIVLMKCCQVGFTVLETLAAIYLALKFEPLKIGFYLPDMALARTKSADRFMPIIRTIPEAYALLTTPDPAALRPRRSEGNLARRRMGGSIFRFLWTTGRAATESHPMDVLCFDEVQEMRIAHIEKTLERLSASKLKLTLMGSTANHPGSDIDHFYQKGSQLRFHTRCPKCEVEEPLDAYFPACIGFDPTFARKGSEVLGEYRYRCRAGHWIDKAQQGQWKPDNPQADAKIISVHFHQMLSPTVSAREMYETYINADDIKNFYNRKLGKPYQDPNELPVSQAHLDACAAEGARMGLTWKTTATNTFMGIDQMGGFNCVVVKERLPDGRHAVIHVEEIYDLDPFERCTQLMKDFGVQICVVEHLPNYNDAHRFANLEDHRGRVFLCTSYGPVEEGFARWGDGPALSVSQRRTDSEARDRCTVHVDQYKAMSVALRRISATHVLFPDPMSRVQEVREKDARFEVPILKERVFPHYLRTALVTKRVNELERLYRTGVEKRGKDPHHAFALMLCDVAMSRAHGTATIILPDMSVPTLPTSPQHHPEIQRILHRRDEGTCGSCSHFRIKDGEAGAAGGGVCAFLPPVTTVMDRDPENGCAGFDPLPQPSV